MKFDRLTLAVMVAAGGFAAWGAQYYTVFDDEAFSLQRYVLPLSELVPGLWRGVEPDPPLYYVLQHAWIGLFGVRPLALRGLSIVAFVAAIPVLRGAAEQWWGARAARYAVVLAGLHPLHLFFGFAARWYALFFLCVAVLLHATAGVARGTAPRRAAIAWVAAALAACYTNYYGPAVVGLVWFWAVWSQTGPARRWNRLLGCVLLGYAAWMPAFVQQLTTFPGATAGGVGRLTGMAATAGRVGVALLSGNLAGPSAWYVWAPLAVFALALVALAWADRAMPAGPTLVAAGCLLAGVVSRTLIDKYALVLSGPLCMVAAARLAEPRTGRLAWVRTTAMAGLLLGWAGCGINWVIEENWSSLRWLDPIRATVKFHLSARVMVATHPSVRYYYGILDPTYWTGRVSPERWQARAEQVLAPAQALERLESAPLAWPAEPQCAVCLIRTAALADPRSAGWAPLEAWLTANLQRGEVETRLEDPAAELKDRLDPGYEHPRYRVVVECFGPRTGSGTSRVGPNRR
ncbi:MAG: hypothetical protein U1A27_11210 [Phycisphaerae bacterium]